MVSYSNQRLLAYTPFISAKGSCITAERDDDDDDCFYTALFSALKQTHCARMWFYSAFLNVDRSGVLTVLAWLVPHETAAILVHLCTPYNHAPRHFITNRKLQTMVRWLRQTAETHRGTTLPYRYILQTQLRTLEIQVSNVYSEPAGQVAIDTACKLTDDQAVSLSFTSGSSLSSNFVFFFLLLIGMVTTVTTNKVTWTLQILWRKVNTKNNSGDKEVSFPVVLFTVVVWSLFLTLLSMTKSGTCWKWPLEGKSH